MALLFFMAVFLWKGSNIIYLGGDDSAFTIYGNIVVSIRLHQYKKKNCILVNLPISKKFN